MKRLLEKTKIIFRLVGFYLLMEEGLGRDWGGVGEGLLEIGEGLGEEG